MSATPLVSVSFCPKSASAEPPSSDADPFEFNDETLDRLANDKVPLPVLRAIQKPPAAGDMLNWKTPPALARIDFFAAGGTFTARGRIEGDVPPLPISSAPPAPDASPENSPGDAVAEIVLPIDLRACFLWHVQSEMKLQRDQVGLTKGQRNWRERFDFLREEGVDLERDFWAFFGHTCVLEIHTSKTGDATQVGTARTWIPLDARSPGTLLAAEELVRARWINLLDKGDKLVNPNVQFVKRFRVDGDAGGAEDRYVLGTGKINSPSWSVGPKGLRITSDAGGLALINGPMESDFLAPPKALDRYRVRLDGPALVPTVESVMTLIYDDLEEEIGSQKFLTQHNGRIDRKRNTRLAGKGARLIGKFNLELAPDATGAEVTLDWKPGTLVSAAPQPPVEKREPKKDIKKTDDDDAPPPPPAN